MKLRATIEQGADGTYDVNLEYTDKVSFGLFGSGKTVEQAIADFFNSRNEMQELYNESGRTFPDNLDFEFKLHAGS